MTQKHEKIFHSDGESNITLCKKILLKPLKEGERERERKKWIS